MTTVDPSPESAEATAGADALDISQSIGPIFATPLTVHFWPESDAINAELRDLILAKEAAGTGLVRSNVGSWHSKTDLFAWDAECVRVLENRVRRLFLAVNNATMGQLKGKGPSNYRIEGWANVNRDRSYNTPHNHSNAIWSGTYYVAPGEPQGGNKFNGMLEFLDPRYGFKLTNTEGKSVDDHCLVKPLPGIMVMFPGWLVHQVHPFHGDGERISIAFNILSTRGSSTSAAP